MPPIVFNNPLQRALMARSANNSRVAFSPLAYNPKQHAYMPSSSVGPTRNKSRRNLFKPNSRGQLTRTLPYIPKQLTFSNGSRPGNTINPNLPKSVISGTSNKTRGASVVLPTSVANTYSKENYNRKSSFAGGKSKTRKNKNYWGYHLTVDASNCNPEALRSKKIITDFVKTLVSDIDMVAYGPPTIVMFGEGNKKGYTLIQLIETSNISAHFVEETNDIYFDIFSCKSFDPKIAIKVIDDYFQPKKTKVRFIKRQA
jgi:S-adenosylmethionine/arginine decarboxylase-like enzyme